MVRVGDSQASPFPIFVNIIGLILTPDLLANNKFAVKKIIYIVLFLLLFFGIIQIFLPGLNDTPCILKDKFNKLDINGIVIKKYIDSDQHSYPMLRIRSNNGLDTVLTVNLVLEKSGLFERINLLDNLYKHKDSNEIYVQHDNRLRLIGKADFGCAEQSKLKK